MRNPPPPSTVAARPPDPRGVKLLRWTLLFLFFDLTFEGLARKLNFKDSNLVIFFVKDVVVALLGVQILQMKRPPGVDFLWASYLITCVLFIPVLLVTAAHDPVLALFGAKEYLLYPVVGLAVYMAYENAPVEKMLGFFRWLSLLVIPTTALAMLQLHLPATHWLNRSVEGETLEGFAAGGYLRVSSTFPFVAQYCAFINAEVFIVAIALSNLRSVNFFMRLVYLSTVPLLIVGSYITGSRGAVLVNCLIIALAAGLSVLKFQVRSALRIVFIIGALLGVLAVAHYAVPSAFQAYSIREKGQLLGASSEIQDRIYGSIFGWVNDVFTTPFFGNGVGIMSNGSERFSSYAATVRGLNWTETDFATTLFEGGIYLVLVWYAFRFLIIAQAVRRCLTMPGEELSLAAAFSAGFVILIGFSGTLGIQPPIAIWFWLSVGASSLLWWKSVEPNRDRPEAPDQDQPQARKLRGQSPYAARLHARKNGA